MSILHRCLWSSRNSFLPRIWDRNTWNLQNQSWRRRRNEGKRGKSYKNWKSEDCFGDVTVRKQDPNNLRSRNKTQSIVFTGMDVVSDVLDSAKQQVVNTERNENFQSHFRKRATPAVSNEFFYIIVRVKNMRKCFVSWKKSRHQLGTRLSIFLTES